MSSHRTLIPINLTLDLTHSLTHPLTHSLTHSPHAQHTILGTITHFRTQVPHVATKLVLPGSFMLAVKRALFTSQSVFFMPLHAYYEVVNVADPTTADVHTMRVSGIRDYFGEKIAYYFAFFRALQQCSALLGRYWSFDAGVLHC